MMQEYDDDFFFEEDKIKTSHVASNEMNINQLLHIEDNATTSRSTTQDFDFTATNTEINDTFDDKIVVEEVLETADCVFNDMRRDRYMVRHQDLM